MTNSDTPPLIRPEEQVVLYDGTCKLCNGWVNFLLRYDRYRTVRLAAVQSEQGKTRARRCCAGRDCRRIKSAPSC